MTRWRGHSNKIAETEVPSDSLCGKIYIPPCSKGHERQAKAYILQPFICNDEVWSLHMIVKFLSLTLDNTTKQSILTKSQFCKLPVKDQSINLHAYG